MIILAGLISRGITTYFVTYPSKFDFRERIYFTLCWLPKATVSAALGGTILKESTILNIPEYISYGEKI